MNIQPEETQPGRIHYPITALNTAKVIFWFFWEFSIHLPELFSLRRFYRARPLNSLSPGVALVGDNLDEVNGIALHARTLVRRMRKKSRRIYLVGIAFHTKKPRMEVPGGSIFMLPARCSIDQPGYPESETAVPRMGLVFKLLRRRPIDLIEIEAPNAMGFLGLLLGKTLKIPTVMHYRTDLPAYAKALIPVRAGAWFVGAWVKYFTRMCDEVVVPSMAFKKKVHLEIGIAESRIHQLPRGVDLSMFNPGKKSDIFWHQTFPGAEGVRIIYFGRVSREKNLPLLAQVYLELVKTRPAVCLTIIGDGPYRDEMMTTMKETPGVFFPGVLRGQNLAAAIASADIMVFPSLTDTFGNTVIEALASGIACIVSDQGGPREIIEENRNGLVFRDNSPQDLLSKLTALIDDPAMLASFKHSARERAMQFTHDISADRFWDYYRDVIRRAAA